MGMVVRSNIMALNAQRQLGMNNSQVSKSLEKLSSGFKINRAGDDASGLAISEKMKAQIKGLETASANSQDGISLIQTAEGALTEVHDMLNRMVELAEKSANGTMENPVDENGNAIDGSYGNAGTDRNAIQDEMDALATEIDRIAKSTNFNGIKLLDGTLGGVSVKKNPAQAPTAPTPTGPSITVGSVGDASTPASFTMAIGADSLKPGTTLNVGGKFFQIQGQVATAANLPTSGTGTESDPFVIQAEGKQVSEVLDTIASKFDSSNPLTIGDKSFTASVADGKLVFTATSNGTVQVNGTDLTAEDLAKEIGKVVEVTTPSDTDIAGKVQASNKNTLDGHVASVGKKATQTLTFDLTALTAGEKININGKEYTIATNGSGGEGKIELGTGSTADADTLKNIKNAIIAELGADSKWEIADDTTDLNASTNTTATIKFTAKAEGEMAAADAVKAGTVGAGTITTAFVDGEAAVSTATNSTAVFALTGIQLNDTVTIGGKTYQFTADGANATGTNIGVAKGSGDNDALTALIGKLNGTDTSGVADKWTASVTASDAGITLTAKTAGSYETMGVDAAPTLKKGSADITNTGAEGKDVAAATKATSAYDLSKTDFTDGSTLTIDGKTFKFSTAGTGATGGAIDVKLGATKQETLDALLAKVKGTTGGTTAWDFASAKLDGEKLVIEATAAGPGKAKLDDATTAGTVNDATTATEAGKATATAQKGSTTLVLRNLDKLKQGDKITVGGKTFVLQTGESAPTVDGSKGEAVLNMSGKAIDAASLKEAIDKAFTDAADPTYNVTTTTSENGATLEIKIEQKTAAAATVEEISNAAKFEAAPAAVSANEGQPAAPGFGPAFASAAAAPAAGTGNTDPVGTTVLNFATQPKVGSTLTFGAEDDTNKIIIEFVKTAGDAVKTQGAVAVVLGANVKDTVTALNAALTDPANATKLANMNMGVAVDAKGTGMEITNTAPTTSDPLANDAAPEVSAEGGGLTLQIGDTYEGFNMMNVAVNHMNMDSLFGDTDAYASMIKLEDGTMSLNVSTQEEAGKSLNAIKTAINTVSTQRAKLGALQNRLEHTINNLDVAAENMNAANSRIRDTDMAKQMMEYTKMNVLTQAAQAMLAQANQQPQSVLQLLQ